MQPLHVRALRVTHPDLGQKPLLAKLREQQPDLGAGTKEVREALAALKAESEVAAAAAAAATTASPAAAEGGAPAAAAMSLACFGCGSLPSEMDDGRQKARLLSQVPTTCWCGADCPANPGAWDLHMVYHKELKRRRKQEEDSGAMQAMQQQNREVAEEQARRAAKSGDKYEELLAEGTRHASQQDTRREARACREAIALRPDKPYVDYNVAAALSSSGHYVEAAQRFLDASERCQVGSELWAKATANVFEMLRQKECAEVAKPDWWNEEGLKALSVSVVRVAPHATIAHLMRADVLKGRSLACGEGLRSSAELKEAASHYERAAALSSAPALNAESFLRPYGGAVPGRGHVNCRLPA